MINILICCITNLFRIILIRKFIVIFKEEGIGVRSKSKEICYIALFYIINTTLYLCYHISWVNLLCNIIGTYMIVTLYCKNIKMRIFVTLSGYLVNMGCDVIGTLLFINYEEGEKYIELFQIVTVLLIFICVLLIEKIICSKSSEKNADNLALLIVPFSSIMIIVVLFYCSDEPEKMVLIPVCIGLVIINMLIFYLYDLLMKSISERYENEILKQKVLIYSEQIDVILRNEEQVKSLKHDMKHHIGELKHFLETEDVKEAIDYLGNMLMSIQAPADAVTSGNLEIDGVLNYMLNKARTELKSMNVRIQIPEKMKHTFDIVVVLSNLLENAIEAAKNTEQKFMNVDVLYKQGVIKIAIANSCNEENIIYLNDKKLGTSKKDEAQHGIGLTSVQSIVEKNQGLLQFEHDKGVFCVKVMMYVDNI